MHLPDPDLDRALRDLPDSAWDLPEGIPELERRSALATSRVQRGRRVRRRVGAGALVLGVYVLGFWSARTTTSVEPAPAVASGERQPGEPQETAPPSLEVEDAPVATRKLAFAPEELEQRARRGSRMRRAARWKQAGDLFLQQRGAVEDALRCYRNHLAAAAPSERARQDSDTWLLAQLKAH